MSTSSYLPHVVAITATCGRHFCIERVAKFFLDQDYEGPLHWIIHNNHSEPVSLGPAPLLPGELLMGNKTVELINRPGPWKTLGAIYNDAIQFIPEDAEIVCFMDDDDIFLPNHIGEGVRGWHRATLRDKEAYKPSHSYYRHHGGVSLVQNTLEPSIFVSADWIKKHGFSDTTSDQHLQWVNPLVSEGKIFVDPEGTPTLIYNWGDDFPTFKTSGNSNNPHNFDNYRAFSKDNGDGIITPLQDVSEYYKV